MTFATLATQAAVSVLREGGIPIVFGVVSDPVGSGIVDSLTEPPGYPITGRIYTIPREVKLRHLLTMLGPDVPRPIRFGVIHSTYPSSLGDVRMLRRLAADNPEVEFVTASTEYRGVPEGADAMLDSVRVLVHALEPKIDYWWEPSGPLGELEAYHRVLLEESSRPIALGNTTASAKGGAMLTIMPDVTKGGRELADIAIQVLNGVPPQSLPIRPPDSFFIALNRDTILAEDLVIPSVLLRLGTVYPLE
jgi:putative ABC transport system substrate-binding protein